MKLRLAYGTTGLDIEVAPEQTTVVEPSHRPGVTDPHGALRRALRFPVAGPPLRDRVKPGQTVRVRDLGASVRIELPAGDLSAAQGVPFLAEAVRQAGFADVAVEYATFSSGNLNGESIAKPQSGP